MRVLFLKKINLLIGALLLTLLTFSLVIYPKEGVQAATAGLKIFWEVVFPSLLPFFVLSEILMGIGVVHFLGVLLEPLMRPLFNVPGVGAFALSMGLAAGYPMDAVITGKFRRANMCTRIEGERLLSFTNTADPLFIFGAVAVGMFGRQELGFIMGIAHYIASFTVGFIYRFYRADRRESNTEPNVILQSNILHRAVRALIKARQEDGRTFGKLMGDAVKESMSTILMIGGFIMLFSVLVRMLEVFGILTLITPVIGAALKIFNLDPSLANAVFNGILEIDLGTMAASKVAAPLGDRVIVASWIIAWSGLCVHGQVASVINDTDIRMGPYMIARLLHGIFAAFFTWLLFIKIYPVIGVMENVIPVWHGYNPLERLILSGRQMLIIVGILLVASFISYLSNKYKLVYLNKNKTVKEL